MFGKGQFNFGLPVGTEFHIGIQLLLEGFDERISEGSLLFRVKIFGKCFPVIPDYKANPLIGLFFQANFHPGFFTFSGFGMFIGIDNKFVEQERAGDRLVDIQV